MGTLGLERVEDEASLSMSSMLESGSQLVIGKYLGSALLLSASPQTVADLELTGVEEEPVEVKPSGQFSWDETHPPPLHHVSL